MADETTATGTPAAAPTIRSLAIAAAGNLTDTDKVAVLVVVDQANQIRVTGIHGEKTDFVQALALGTVVMAKMLAPVEAVPPVPVDGQAAAAA